MRIAWKFGNPPPTHTQTGQWTSVSTKVGRILEEAVKQQLRDLQGALESVSNVSYKKKKKSPVTRDFCVLGSSEESQQKDIETGAR